MSLLFNAFCFVLSLQAGVVATSAIGLTIMVITVFYNIYAPNLKDEKYQSSQYVFLSFYLAITSLAFSMAFISSFWPRIKLLKLSAVILSIGTLLYVIISILSFIRDDEVMMYVCPGMRCPDHHWLQDARWRKFYFRNGKVKQNLSATEPKTDYQKSFKVTALSDLRLHSNQSKSTTNEEGRKRHKNTDLAMPPLVPLRNITVLAAANESGEDVMLLMFVSFFYNVLITGFFVYTILTFLSFERHLKDLEEGPEHRQSRN